MYSPSYREALKNSFILVWGNKSFWIFGILAALFVSPFGMGGFFGQMILAGSETIPLSYFPWGGFFNFLANSGPANFVSAIWLLEIILAIFIIMVFVSVCAQTSLIINTCEYYKKKTHSKLADTWHKSYKYFWKVLGFDLIRKITLVLLMAFSAGVWFITTNNDFWTKLFLILSFIIAMFLMLVVSSITIYASGYAVIDNENFWVSLQKGAVLFKDHFLVSFEISLVMIFLDLILASFISIAIVLSFIPVTILWFLAGLANSLFLLNLALIVSLFIIIFLIIIIGGFYNAFNTGTWMYLFMKMHHKGIFSRIGHLFIKLFQK